MFTPVIASYGNVVSIRSMGKSAGGALSFGSIIGGSGSGEWLMRLDGFSVKKLRITGFHNSFTYSVLSQ